ncbi:hypothetical protein QQP08_007011, partial [Theobroma cacao]
MYQDVFGLCFDDVTPECERGIGLERVLPSPHFSCYLIRGNRRRIINVAYPETVVKVFWVFKINWSNEK